MKQIFPDNKTHPLKAVPLYKQLKRQIEHEILSENWRPKEKIPSEAELSKMFSVSRVTVRAAIKELSSEGKLLIIQGKGTYVAPLKNKQLFVIDVPSFSQMCIENGMEPSRVQIKNELAKASLKDSECLSVPEGDDIILLSRILYGNSYPLMIAEDRILPSYKAILEKNMELYSLNEVMKEIGNINDFVTLERTIEICYATLEEAKYLNTQPGEVLLLVKDLAADSLTKKPVRRTKLLMVGDRAKIGYKC